MVHFISINVLRDFWLKLLQEYQKFYLELEPEQEETFDYKINHDVVTGNIMEKMTFQSEDEMNYFLYCDVPMEVFGLASVTYNNVALDLIKYIQQHPDDKICLISKEYSKSIPATLFFLSKTGCVCNNIIFYQKDNEIQKLWNECDIWITDEPAILNAKPENKVSIKVQRDFNENISSTNIIKQLNELLKNEETQTQS